MENLETTSELCYPQLLNISCKKPGTSHSDALLSYSLLSFMSFLTVALNLLVIISIAHFRQLHTPTNLLILSLAVADFLIGLLLIPIQILLTESCWFLGNVVCGLYHFTNFVITSSSVGSVVLISVDRYLAICDPLHYNTKVTMDRTKLCVCACWLSAIIYNSVIMKDFLRDPGAQSSCYGECLVVVNTIVGAVDVVCTFIGPITVIVVLYVKIFIVAVSQARAMQSRVVVITLQQTVKAKTVKANKSEIKAARTLGIVILVYIVTFCPYYAPSFTGQDIENSSSSLPVVALWCFNSCTNPVIYAFFYPWFRKSLKLIATMQILQPHSSNAKVL